MKSGFPEKDIGSHKLHTFNPINSTIQDRSLDKQIYQQFFSPPQDQPPNDYHQIERLMIEVTELMGAIAEEKSRLEQAVQERDASSNNYYNTLQQQTQLLKANKLQESLTNKSTAVHGQIRHSEDAVWNSYLTRKSLEEASIFLDAAANPAAHISDLLQASKPNIKKAKQPTIEVHRTLFPSTYRNFQRTTKPKS